MFSPIHVEDFDQWMIECIHAKDCDMPKRTRSTPETGFDVGWFRERYKTCGLTLESVAKAMGWTTTSAARLAKGERKLQIDEVGRLASLLKVDAPTVLSKAGMGGKLTELYGVGTGISKALGPTTVPLIGYFDGDYCFHEQAIGLVDGQGAAWTGEGKPRAARFQTPGGPFDGAIVYFEEIGAKDAAAAVSGALGRLCLVGWGEGRCELLAVQRGYEPKRYSLVRLDGKLARADVEIRSAFPILAIRFGGPRE